jgi:hypothetical protein
MPHVLKEKKEGEEAEEKIVDRRMEKQFINRYQQPG